MRNAFALFLGLAGCGLAFGAASERLSVADAYVRQAPPGAPATGAFMVLRNDGGTDVRVVGASSPASRIAELHGHRHEDAVMKMRAVAAIDVRANDSAVLRPGGLHVMLIGLEAPLQAGERVPITLHLDDGSSLQIDAEVVRPAGSR